MLAYDASKGPVSELIGGHLAIDPLLTWADLENLMITEYANEGTTIESVRGLTKLRKARDKIRKKFEAKST